MSPTAYALNVANAAFARGVDPHRLQPMQALRSYLARQLLDTGPTTPQPAAPAEGAPIQVRWCRAGTPGEVGEVWCPGTYLRTIGSGHTRRYMVSCTTPRSAGNVVVPVAPESVRFLSQPGPQP